MLMRILTLSVMLIARFYSTTAQLSAVSNAAPSQNSYKAFWKFGRVVIQEVANQQDPVNGALEFSDGRILSWGGSSIRLWNSAGMPVTSFDVPELNGVLKLSGERVLTYSRDGHLQIWNPEGKLLTSIASLDNSISGAIELSDGRLLSWSSDDSIRLWSSEGEQIGIFAKNLKSSSCHISDVLELTNGQILTWSFENDACLWRTNGDIQSNLGETAGVEELNDGRILTWSVLADHLVLWTTKGELQKVLKSATRVQGVQELTDGRILSWNDQGLLTFWSSSGEMLKTTSDPVGEYMMGMLELSNGHLLSYGLFMHNILWSADGERLITLENTTELYCSGAVNAIELTDKNILIYNQGSEFCLYDAQGKLLQNLDRDTSNAIEGVLGLNYGRFLSWDSIGNLYFWSDKGKLIRKLLSSK